MVLMTKIEEKKLLPICLSLGLHKGRPNYRRRTSSTSELSFKFLIFLYSVGHIFPTGPAFGSALLMRIPADPDPHIEPVINFCPNEVEISQIQAGIFG